MINNMRMASKYQKDIHTQFFERGFISIFSVMIIMGILALVAIGFSNITRQAQRRTLDNQLNTEAFYAAEAGVNDARVVIAKIPGVTKTVCQGPMVGFHYALDPSINTSYTCLLITSGATDLRYTSIPVEGSASAKVVGLESSNGNLIKSFTVSWDTVANAAATVITDAPANYPGILPTVATWGSNLGMLRIDIVPTNVPTDALDRASLANKGYTFFLYPNTTGSGNAATVYARAVGTEPGELVNVTCAAKPCSVDITLGSGLSAKYSVRLQAVYNPVSATISNVKDSGGAPVTLINGQAIVDVTGKAGDVLRRIQVRLPYSDGNLLSGFALLSADSICKRLNVGNISTIVGAPPSAQPSDTAVGGPCTLVL